MLLDIEMPDIDGLTVAAILAEQAPACRCRIATTFGRPDCRRRAMESGAFGFRVKDAPVGQLGDAIGHAATESGSSIRPSPRRRSHLACRR